jgi:hypothetical protein
MPDPSLRRRSRRKKLIAILASLGILGMLGTVLGAIVIPFLAPDPPRGRAARDTRLSPSSTTPAVVIRPLAVRVVDRSRATTPDQCPPVVPPQGSAHFETCDVEKTAAYMLPPTTLQLQLTGVESRKAPVGDTYIVQISMDAASSAAFADYTRAHVGKQLAFVRKGVVVSAPAINEPINAPALQISGNLTRPQAENIARMLRDEA